MLGLSRFFKFFWESLELSMKMEALEGSLFSATPVHLYMFLLSFLLPEMTAT